MADGVLEWHKDGHLVSMWVDTSELVVNPLPCPMDEDADCRIDGGCVFVYHVNLYGLDCNVGAGPPDETVEFAWAWDGPSYDRDGGQLWIIPVDDPTFAAWASQFGDV